MSKTVKSIICGKVEMLSKDSTILDAARLISKHNIGAVPIYDKDENDCIGLVTDRDIVIRGLAAERDLNTKVSEVMTEGVLYVDANDDISKAASLMKEKKVRRLLVKENNKFVGLISLGDLSCSCHGSEIEKVVIDALHGISSGPSSH